MNAEQPAFLVPSLPAVVRWRNDAVEVADLDELVIRRVTGSLREELERLLGGGALGPQLAAVSEHPSTWTRLATGARLPLTPAGALRLEGFDTLFVELTRACNQRCVHCYAEGGSGGAAELAPAACHALLDELPGLGFRRVQLTGGEPLLCAFLPELVQHVHELDGVLGCEIYTNGTLLTAPLLETLAPSQPSFALSYYSLHASTHDAVTGVPGSHALTTEAIRRIVARGLPLRVSIIAMQENAADVRATVEFVRELGVTSVSWGRSHEVGRGTYFDAHFDAPEEQPSEGVEGVETDCKGRLCIAADGAVYPCIFNRADRLGTLVARRLAEIVEHPTLPPACDPSTAGQLTALRAKLPCAACKLTAYALRALSCP